MSRGPEARAQRLQRSCSGTVHIKEKPMSRMSWIWMVAVASAAMGADTQKPPGPPAGAPTPQQQEEGVIDPRADKELRKMSEYLAGLKTFRVEAVTVDERVATDGQKIQELKESTVSVQRPSKLRVDRVGPAGHVTLRVDGKRAVL